jgi:tRNA A37 threonylcarbamoyladenosine modification protein TsaB
MISLVIDAASDKIFFSIIKDDKSYTTNHLNSRENFDKIIILLNNFLNDQGVILSQIKKIYINRGPGKFSSLRISISIAKSFVLANNIQLVGFTSADLENRNDFKYLVELDKKDKLTKDLINPLYSS